MVYSPAPGTSVGHGFGADVTFDAVDAFVAVELPPEIDAVGSMRFLEEDDRDVGGPGGLHYALGPADHLR